MMPLIIQNTQKTGLTWKIADNFILTFYSLLHCVGIAARSPPLHAPAETGMSANCMLM